MGSRARLLLSNKPQIIVTRIVGWFEISKARMFLWSYVTGCDNTVTSGREMSTEELIVSGDIELLCYESRLETTLPVYTLYSL